LGHSKYQKQQGMMLKLDLKKGFSENGWFGWNVHFLRDPYMSKMNDDTGPYLFWKPHRGKEGRPFLKFPIQYCWTTLAKLIHYLDY
jgi:hypothetical protein